ncbi:MAG TPA: SDR family NAD(P)-dependent oxidoreductase [Acidimicrobiia bacterium]|nr:SDR family NAD(P)-dependent oxidoreductase [Acidimicrobiia bacterium]
MNDAGDLVGRVAVVTGAGSGIGRASAIALAAAGASVAVADIDDPGTAETVARIVGEGGAARAFHVDVGEPSSCEALMAGAVEAFGGLHVLHNSAGVALMGRGDGLFHRIDPDVWDRVIRINLSGTFYCCHYAFPYLRDSGGGSIINTGSSMSTLPNGSLDAYAASKGGVAMLTKSMAMGAGQRGIRVNTICPGYVDTPINSAIWDNEEARLGFEADHATGLQTPEEIADVVVFLAGDASRSLTGATITCDRGWTAFKLPAAARPPRRPPA